MLLINQLIVVTHVFILGTFAALIFWPLDFDYSELNQAGSSLASSEVVLAGRADRLNNHAIALFLGSIHTGNPKRHNRGVRVEIRVLLVLRANLFYGEEKLILYALEHAHVTNQIIGISEAAERCFDKPASVLTLSDSATIVLLIRSPWKDWDAEYMLKRRNRFLLRMAEEGFVTDIQAKDAIKDPLTTCPYR